MKANRIVVNMFIRGPKVQLMYCDSILIHFARAEKSGAYGNSKIADPMLDCPRFCIFTSKLDAASFSANCQFALLK